MNKHLLKNRLKGLDIQIFTLSQKTQKNLIISNSQSDYYSSIGLKNKIELEEVVIHHFVNLPLNLMVEQ